MDDITSQIYENKLSSRLEGGTRNELIASYKKMKGSTYRPLHMHKALRKNDPEDDVTKSTLSKNKVLPLQKSSPTNEINIKTSKKRKLGEFSNDETLDFDSHFSAPKKAKLVAPKNPPKKRKAINKKINFLNGHDSFSKFYGLVWSQNSCAYDAVLTLLYNFWYDNKEIWNSAILHAGNSTINNLSTFFVSIEQNVNILEAVHNNWRQSLHATDSVHFQFGHYTAIQNLFDKLTCIASPVRCVSITCSKGHIKHQNALNTTEVSFGTYNFTSSSQAINTQILETTCQSCRICTARCHMEQHFVSTPPLLFIEFANNVPSTINTTMIAETMPGCPTYSLKGVIYFGSSHYTCRFISSNGVVYFHDGMTLGRHMLTDSENLASMNLTSCRGANAVCAIYMINQSA